MGCNIPPLMLHFDINKTIIISDPVSNISTDQMLNSLLSECIWGTLKPRILQENSGIEVVDSSDITSSCGNSHDVIIGDITDCNNNKLQPQGGEKWSLNDWKIYSPRPSNSQPEKNSLTFGEFIENYDFMIKMTRNEMKEHKTKFTCDGNPGESCQESFKILQDSLRTPLEFRAKNILQFEAGNVPQYDSRDEKNISDTSENISSLNNKTEDKTDICGMIFKSGSYHIIPSFFKLASYLHQLKIDFRIIFRTYGTDIDRVAEEYNLYCEGKHPVFPLSSTLSSSLSSPLSSSLSSPLSPPLSPPEASLYAATTNMKISDDKEAAVADGKDTASFFDTNISPPILQINSNESTISVQRVKMDGTGTEGIDRRLHLPNFLGVLRRTGAGADGVQMQHTNSCGVRTYCEIFF